MAIKDVGPFKGLDLRGVLDTSDQKTLRVANNVDYLSDGSFKERDGLRLVAQVDSNSRGLYSVGGWLRCALAAGHSKPASVQSTTPIIYDAIGDGTIYSETSIDKVLSVSSWDADGAIGIYPVLVIRRTDGTRELHWIKDTPAPAVNGSPPPPFIASTDTVETKVDLPFKIGDSILKIQSKICAVDNTNGAVWFCSTVNGVTDWTTAADAGFLPVIRHATGDRSIQGLSFYDSLMAVMFSDSIQLWQMDPNPARHQFVRVLSGPGTQFGSSVVNVRGDLVYFSRGVFSSLRQSAINGQLVDGDIGAKIAPQTKQYETIEPISFWSQGRGAYYCFFGTVGFRWLSSPDEKRKGWTTYTLPVSVEAAVEHLGEIYIRNGANIYRFESGYADGSTYTVRTQPLALDFPGEMKNIDTMTATITGTPTVNCLPDMRDSSVVDRLFTLSGPTASLNDLAVFENSEAPAFEFTGSLGGATPFTMNHFMLDVKRA